MMSEGQTSNKGIHYVLLAGYAIGWWSSLALLTTWVTHLPVMLIIGVTLTLAGLPALVSPAAWRIPVTTLALGFYGIFGFHAVFVYALSSAPPLQANILVDVWPLLIVLLTPVFIRHAPLRLRHLIGGLMGFAGTILILAGPAPELGFHADALPGYLAALAAGVIWATYSVLTKRVAAFPTLSVSAFCLLSGLAAITIYLLTGGREMPRAGDWPVLVLMAVGPMGSAFYTWDAALKRGDTRVIGALSYLVPLFATLLLATVGRRTLTWSAGLAVILIVGGALIGSVRLKRPAANPSQTRS